MHDLTKEPILRLEDTSFSYGSGSEVLHSVSLTVHKGDYLGLIGPNGGGKTTLLKIALGLLKPTTGKVEWFGKDIQRFKEWYRIGYVSQKATEFDSLFPATVEEVVLMGRYARRGFFNRINDVDRQKAEEALQEVHMLEYRNRRISDLSGGQKQRVFIARALASEPEILMLDEPTTGVDQETQTQFYELLKELNERQNLTLVLVSHDLERIAKQATHVAIIEKTLRYYENPLEAIEKEQHIDHHY
jgi:zinc transport system ATP-binding protein